ncbi:hypothetical protein RND71_040327 [Anisodus tanguticus]|uniref:PPM-type phosphatase domain-containing protein n=1 Tax=Anisodus tanguticus TaxID=243964 RepID=A0AAE1QSM9_9SOLA|nr:hypothetical protein RND71_040327 [Anisodus tanguticus]
MFTSVEENSIGIHLATIECPSWIKQIQFSGVFDGHGHFVAKRVRDSLPLKLRAEWEDNIKDDEYAQDLVFGNIGDSRVVLAMRDMDGSLMEVQLTVDLKPNLPVEAESIRKCKGRVFALRNEPDVARVWLLNSNSPGLAMARAVGDFGLISVPKISYRHLTEKDQFIVLATDGEMVNIVASASLRSFAARSLVVAAVRGWRTKYPTSKVDDCAVVCLFLDSNSIVSSTACSTEQDDKTVREGDDISEKEKEEVSDREELLSEEEGSVWSALDEVSRANTLLTLPRFVPEKEEKRAAGGSKSK